MLYILILNGEGNDPRQVKVFDSPDARARATRDAILDPDSIENQGVPCPDLLTLASEGVVHFESDPSIEWLDVEIPNVPEKVGAVLREFADQVQNQEPRRDSDMDAAELIRVLARIVEGKPLRRSFGAPGDWGYSNPIGKALAGK
jgi:hypothetical protein